MKSINNTIPLVLPKNSTLALDIRTRLYLLKELDFYYTELLDLLTKSSNGTLKESDRKKLKRILKDKILDFNEVDRGLIFSKAFVDKIDSFPQDFLGTLDNDKYSTFTNYGKNPEAFVNKVKEEFKDFSKRIMFVRAKLVIRELAYNILKDDEIILDLLSISTKYLNCPHITRLIEVRRDERIYKRDKNSKNFMSKFSKIVNGDTKKKPRKSWYWRAHYYYFELKSCIETYNKIKDKKKSKFYLEDVKIRWGIPDSCFKNILQKLDTPTNLALEILETWGAIKSGEQFLKGYNKNVKEMKDFNFDLNFLPEEVFSFFDLMSINPLLFTKLDPFQCLSDLNIK